MKLCLGMMTHNDNHWLRLHLPAIASAFDGVVIATDDDKMTTHRTIEIALAADVKKLDIFEHSFNDNWSEMFNHTIEHAEKLGYDAILRLDPDELMFPDHIQRVRELLEDKVSAIGCVPRYNFWLDRLHYVEQAPFYPDWQRRAFCLNRGVKYSGQRHEGLTWPSDTMKRYMPLAIVAPIFHYGDIYLPNILARDLKYLNMAHRDAGAPELAERPADRAIPHRDTVLFEGQQPINPNVCGIYAPFTENSNA